MLESSTPLSPLTLACGVEVVPAVHVPHEGHLPQRVATHCRREVLGGLQLVRLAERLGEVVVNDGDGGGH